MHDLCLTHDIVNGVADGPQILGLLGFYPPSKNLRARDPSFISFTRYNYLKNEPINKSFVIKNVHDYLVKPVRGNFDRK